MFKLYKYLYYRLYSWNLKKWGEQDLPHYNAMLAVSFMMILNFGIIAGILDMFDIARIFIERTPRFELFIIFSIVAALNYYWLVRNEKYKQLEKEYKNEPKSKRTRNTILLWLYVILSFVAISFIAILSGKLKGLQ